MKTRVTVGSHLEIKLDAYNAVGSPECARISYWEGAKF